MRSTASYDTKLKPHEPSLSSCAWLCHQSALLPGAFFYYPTFHFQRAIKLLHVTLPTWKASVSDSSRRELSVAGLRSTGDLLVATQPLGKAQIWILTSIFLSIRFRFWWSFEWPWSQPVIRSRFFTAALQPQHAEISSPNSDRRFHVWQWFSVGIAL